ncbi:hypothetical protein D7V88_26120 [Corallococcus terminator]|uniref:Uncharacterized protein n=2 Tax=Corallococcus terminator TaxID=2316733 RepID=A0A3A8IDU4_9BACT|nr:hypothetical protein D7V88_26120 [Corallococcus terminator]
MLACTPQGEAQVAPAPDDKMDVKVVTEWRPKAVDRNAPKLAVGESCVEGGDSSCESGRCVHMPGAGLGQGYYCTRECTRTAECPAEWPCVKVAPGVSEGLCQPKAARHE